MGISLVSFHEYDLYLWEFFKCALDRAKRMCIIHPNNSSKITQIDSRCAQDRRVRRSNCPICSR